MIRARILGTGKAVPSRVVTNDDLARIVDTSDQWIVERTGIRERRILEEGRTTSDLATEAATNALAAAGIAAGELDAIIVSTVTPDSPLPACAVHVQRKLGATCPAFDIAAACAGFLYGLGIAEGFIATAAYRRVLVIGVEVLSRWMLDWSDRNTCVLFGDGAGAVVLGPADGDRGILSVHLFSDGSQAGVLHVPAGGVELPTSQATVEARQHFVKMNGKGVFAHAVRNMSRAAQVALEANQLSADDIDWFVAHQANLRIVEGVAEKLRLPLARFYLNLQRYGNTSSASIPIALDEAVRDGSIKRGQLLLMGALGAGLSWGSAIVRW